MLSLLSQLFPSIQGNRLAGTRREKLLQFLLAAALLAALILGIVDLGIGASQLALLPFAAAAICIVGLIFSFRNQYYLAAFLLSALILFLLVFITIQDASLQHPILAAYPVFIILTTYLFGKNAVLTTTLFSIFSILLVFTFAYLGYIQPPDVFGVNLLLFPTLIFGLIGVITWLALDAHERRLARLVESYDLTLEGWALALEFRDGETEGHSHRVTNLCLELARAMDVPEDRIPQIRRGALLHDIGKMALPDYIITKTGELTEAEWEVVKQHPRLAGELLKMIPFLENAKDIPFYHHEWWDGSGYPEGLAGEDIPLAARIFAIADVWDSLSSDRPYRDAWPPEKVLAYIQENTGTHFDPRVVEAFLGLLMESDLFADKQ